MKYLKALLTIIFLAAACLSLAQHKGATSPTDTITLKADTLQSSAPGVSDADTEEDTAPGFLLVGAALIFILLFGKIAIMLIIAIISIVFIIIAIGIISASTLVGIFNKSFSKGFRLFLVSCTTLSGLIAGSIGFWYLNSTWHWVATKTAFILGSIAGAIAGLLSGLLLFYAIQKLICFLRSRLGKKNNSI